MVMICIHFLLLLIVRASIDQGIQCGQAAACACKNLKSHRVIHVSEKPFSCIPCGISFKRASVLQKAQFKFATHWKQIFPMPKVLLRCHRIRQSETTRSCYTQWFETLLVYSCLQCSKTFRILSLLKSHKKIHADIRPFSCEECAKSFRRAEHLENHRTTHSEERSFKCNICDKTFSIMQKLRIHQRGHTGAKLFPCMLCGMLNQATSNLINSRILMWNPSHANNVWRYSKHALTSQGTEQFIQKRGHSPATNVQCHLKIGLTSQGIKQFIKEERPFFCDQCGQSFKSEQEVVLHKKMYHS